MSKKEQKSFNEELDKLFDQWINEIEKNIANSDKEDQYREGGTGKVIFTRDGLLEKNDPSIDVYQDWVNASRRILFILKDQPTKWCDDVRLWLKDLDTDTKENRDDKKKNRALGKKFIRNIANIFYGLANATAEDDCAFEQLTYDDVALCFNTRPFGILETKKQGGGTTLGNTKLNRCLYTYESFIVRQLEIMQPNICVSTSWIITSFLKKQAGSVVSFPGHKGMFYVKASKTLYLTSYHPSARNSYADFYERVMNDFRFFLRSNEAKEFLGQKEA